MLKWIKLRTYPAAINIPEITMERRLGRIGRIRAAMKDPKMPRKKLRRLQAELDAHLKYLQDAADASAEVQDGAA